MTFLPVATAEPMRVQDLRRDFSNPSSMSTSQAYAQQMDPGIQAQRREQAAHTEGYQTGYSEGLAAGKASASELKAKTADALTQVADAVASSVEQTVKSDITVVAEAAWALSAWILKREASLDKLCLLPALEDAMKALDATVEVTLHANQATLGAMETTARERSWKTRVDSSLGDAELRVTTASGSRVEATLASIGRRAITTLTTAPTENK